MTLNIFHSDEFGDVGAVKIDGKMWFAATDVAKTLNLTTWYVLKKYVEKEHQKIIELDKPVNRSKNRTVIDTYGVHQFVEQSTEYTAKEYEEWLNSLEISDAEIDSLSSEDDTGISDIGILCSFLDTDLESFHSNEFGQVRAIYINDEPWFIGKDIATALGYERPTDAVRRHVDESDKGVAELETGGGTQQLAVINESGLYTLIFSSKLESAKEFKRWVTSEVLPSLRKHGGYISGQENISNEELLCKAILYAQSKIEERDKIIEEMKPKADFADAVTDGEGEITIGELAKMICENGVEIGQNRLLRWMREHGYLMKQKNSYNMPKQQSVERGYLSIREGIDPENGRRLNKKAMVSPKGQKYFVNKLVKEL